MKKVNRLTIFFVLHKLQLIKSFENSDYTQSKDVPEESWLKKKLLKLKGL